MNIVNLRDDIGSDFEVLEYLGGSNISFIAEASPKRNILELGLKKGQIIALKCPVTPTPDIRSRFMREAHILEQLVSSEYVIGSHGIYERQRDNFPLIILEKADQSLYNKVIRQYDGKKVPEEMKDETMRRSCNALLDLSKITENGISYIHMDFKPQNVLIVREIIKVADFGSAGAPFSNILTSKGVYGTYSLHGTLMWMPPENIGDENERKAVISSDVYSLGLVAFFLETHSNPYEQQEGLMSSIKRLQQAKLGIGDYKDFMKHCLVELKDKFDTPSERIEAIRIATDPDPDKRYKTPMEFLDGYTLVTRNSVLEARYKGIEDMLSKPADPVMKTTDPQAIDKMLRILDDMKDYQDNHRVTRSDFVDKAKVLIKERAARDYASLEEYMNNKEHGFQRDYLALSSPGKQKELIRRMAAVMHAYGNTFPEHGFTQSPRISPDDKQKIDEIVSAKYAKFATGSKGKKA